MATLPPVTDTIARFVTETDLSAVSAKTRVNATMHILDVLGVALAGVSTPPAEIALDYCKRLGFATEASIWGTHVKASVSTAAFANGLLAHALDFDDWDAFIHVGHPTSMLIGAALPLAEKIGASGKDFVQTLPVVSFVAGDIVLSFDGYWFRERGEDVYVFNCVAEDARRSAAAGGKNRRAGQGSSQSLRAWHRSDL